jgi:glycosyltransferase involved in cell wall biosynthesis
VTAFDVVFNREVAGDAGTWFRTPDDVARNCVAVESDPVAAHERGSRGQADVAVRYRWDDVAEAYEDLARQLSTRPAR